ncbi:MAG: SiaB family protein kinase [Flavobacteriales bacterium]|nr:SiaB family protein kinase [Flavobacteriales bacterium]MCW8914034.1 SiaB family protein kinase [Flavobacteriales bacterium]MCW8938092.1 SiaB family protein kinase [Flavobacteriales bacterium]MCW8941130.1 SiaB family protein kinase [Flavobacteriales bacterium]MCW8968037.1 SiaB family protein kinase [Flavobacteriales bacterium]
MENIHDFYTKMEEGNIMLSFKGEVTSDLLTSILQIMESKMDTLEEPPVVKKKVYNILVECLQNLYHHLENDDFATPINEKSALFMIKKQNDEYSIMTGNYMVKENVMPMKKRLDTINAMDSMQLKTYYKEVLNNGEMSSKGGGGLGMIDIARKSGKKLEYRFDDVDDKLTFFSLNVKVAQNRNKEEKEEKVK